MIRIWSKEQFEGIQKDEVSNYKELHEISLDNFDIATTSGDKILKDIWMILLNANELSGTKTKRVWYKSKSADLERGICASTSYNNKYQRYLFKVIFLQTLSPHLLQSLKDILKL